MNIDELNLYKKKIVECLKVLDPYKIVLFGSLAWGNPNNHSDIDLLVVLNNDNVSSSYIDHLKKKVMVRNAIAELNKAVAIDLIVYSKPELKKMLEFESVFVKNILEKGTTLYERTDKTVA